MKIEIDLNNSDWKLELFLFDPGTAGIRVFCPTCSHEVIILRDALWQTALRCQCAEHQHIEV